MSKSKKLKPGDVITLRRANGSWLETIYAFPVNHISAGGEIVHANQFHPGTLGIITESYPGRRTKYSRYQVMIDGVVYRVSIDSVYCISSSQK